MMGSVTASPAIVVKDLSKRYGRSEAVRGSPSSVGRGEVFGLLGPNGAGKTTTVEILEGHRRRSGGERARARPRPGPAVRDLRARVGIVLQSCGTYPHLTVRETVAHWASLYPAPRGVDGDARARGPGGGGGQARTHALGRPAAAAGLRARARRRPRADLPRRADDGVRPGGAAGGVGRRARAARPRQDDPADHALPRRGAGARRPRGDRQGRADPRRGPAGRARRRRVALPRRLPRRRTGSCVERFTEDPTALLHELTAEAMARGERLEDLSVTRPSLEEVYLELTAEEPVAA